MCRCPPDLLLIRIGSLALVQLKRVDNRDPISQSLSPVWAPFILHATVLYAARGPWSTRPLAWNISELATGMLSALIPRLLRLLDTRDLP